MDPGRQEQHSTPSPGPGWDRPIPPSLPAKHHSSGTPSLASPSSFSCFCSFKLEQTSLRLSHQLHLFLSGSNRPHQAAEEELWRWERLDHTGKTSGSGFGGFSPVPALALTDS